MSVGWADIEKIITSAPRRDRRTGALPDRAGLALVELFDRRDEAQRKALVPQFEGRLKLHRAEGWDADWWDRSWGAHCLAVVGAAVLGGPAAVARVLGRRDIADLLRPAADRDIADVLQRRGVAWVPDVVVRLAERIRGEQDGALWTLVDTLVRRFETPVPTSDGYVLGWLRSEPMSCDDRLLDALVPRVFEVAGAGALLAGPSWQQGEAPWTTFAKLAASGRLDRADLIAGCVSRLLRGEQPASVRGFLALYNGLAPSVDDLAAHTMSYLRLLPDAHSTVATSAQAALRTLDEAGTLSPEQVVEASRAVLFRSEKHLLRTQFVWLGQAVKRHPAHAGALLATAPTAFGCEAAAVQERAIALLAKHLPKLPDDQAEMVRDELRAALPMLGATVRGEAAALLGEPVTVEVDPAFDLPVPVSRDLPPPIDSVGELVQEISVFFEAPAVDPVSLERILAGLARASAADRVALAAGLESVHLADPFWADPTDVSEILRYVIRSTRGDATGGRGWFTGLFGADDALPKHLKPLRGTPQVAVVGRMYELARRLRTPVATPYLSEPVTVSGLIDPAALVAALRLCEDTNRKPAPRDLEQALLRLPAEIDPDVVARAGALTSAEGRRAAKVLANGGFPHPTTTPAPVPGLDDPAVLSVSAATGDSAILTELSGIAGSAPGLAGLWNIDIQCWPMVMPRHRDVIAAHATAVLRIAGEHAKGGGAVLPLLAESDGPAGTGMSTLLAQGLGLGHSDDRTAAVDALVIMAARTATGTEWSPAEVGRAVAGLVRTGQLKTSRVARALTEVAKAGAHAAVWEVARAALPDLLAGDRLTGVPDLLGLAAECAAQVGARDSIPGLDTHADRPGTTRIAVEARRLRKALTA